MADILASNLDAELMALGGEDQEVKRHAERIIANQPDLIARSTVGAVETVLERVFADTEIERQFFNAGIRLTTMRGRVAKKVLELLGEDFARIGIMAIGDVRLPEFADREARKILQRSHEIHLNIFERRGGSYDLSSRGLDISRKRLIAYLNEYYGFGEELLEKMAKSSCLTSGGMRALDDVMTGISQLAKRVDDQGKVSFDLREFHPDNSFGTWGAIADLRTNSGLTGSVKTVPTRAEDALHLTTEAVQKVYEQEGVDPKMLDAWCITPVGNPSGTAMLPEQLLGVVESILSNQPQAVIILDSTYVRTLPVEKARALLSGIMTRKSLLNRIIFVDSFSKTHGLCGERLGMFFSSNAELFDSIHRVNLTLSAGNGISKDALALAITEPDNVREQTFRDLHVFWAKERAGLYKYLMDGGRFSGLFEEEQPHLNVPELQESLGLYLFLKLKPGVTGQDVVLKTGCLGVETNMASGKYLRFSVGLITEPTYAKFLMI